MSATSPLLNISSPLDLLANLATQSYGVKIPAVALGKMLSKGGPIQADLVAALDAGKNDLPAFLSNGKDRP